MGAEAVIMAVEVTVDITEAVAWLAEVRGVARFHEKPSGPVIRVGIPRAGDDRVVIVVPYSDPVEGLLLAVTDARAEFEATHRRARLRLA